MFSNSLPTERVALVGVIDPDNYSANTYLTEFVPVAKFRRVMAVISVGTMETNSVVAAKLQRASDAAGTGAEDISGAAITNLTAAGTDSDKQSIINYLTDSEAGDDKMFIGLSVTVSVAASDMSGHLFGFDPFNAPASDADVTSVDQIVSV